ncbi:asparaginase domain-containing protein [Brucella abortus]|nr:asparaginase domain-containing protein [Brucella abortus]
MLFLTNSAILAATASISIHLSGLRIILMNGSGTEPSTGVWSHTARTRWRSAFLAQLTISSRKPVVFTGAQRSADEPDADGPRNLADAISVAASPEARDLGTLVVFAGKVLSSIDATKIHTSKLEAYDAPDMGRSTWWITARYSSQENRWAIR